MVPEGWRDAEVGDFVREVVRRGGDDLPVLSVSKDLGIVLQTEKFGRILASDDRRRYKRVRRGEFAYDPMLLWSGSIARQKHVDEGVVSPVYHVFEVEQTSVDPQFVEHVLTAERMLTRYEAISEGTNHRRRKAPFDGFERLSIPLPPLPEQRKIAAILSSVDDAIAATRKVIEQTERVKQGLLQTLMTRGIGHTRFKQTEIGEIPEEWEVTKLEELAAVERGKFTARPRNDPKYYGGDVPFVQTGDVAAARLELRNHSQTLNQAGLKVSRLFPAGTILITIAANIGSVAEAKYPVAFPDSLVGIQPRPGVSGRWLLYHLHTRQGELDGVATQNAQKNINLQVLRPLLIAVPPLREQEEIAATLDEVGYYLDSADQAVVRLQTLKRGLLQHLLTGRVRVIPD